MGDRTISTDVRIISDLMSTNLFCVMWGCPAAQATNISEIDEGSSTLERTWPKIEAARCKREIDDASKRARTHPDMCVLLRAEFRGGDFEMNGNIYFMYLALPFGRRGGPPYFVSVGGGITISHRNFANTDKLRGGHP